MRLRSGRITGPVSSPKTPSLKQPVATKHKVDPKRIMSTIIKHMDKWSEITIKYYPISSPNTTEYILEKFVYLNKLSDCMTPMFKVLNQFFDDIAGYNPEIISDYNSFAGSCLVEFNGFIGESYCAKEINTFVEKATSLQHKLREEQVSK